MPDGRRLPPERKADMFDEIKWMIIEFLIRHRVLAVVRVRAQGGCMNGQKRCCTR